MADSSQLTADSFYLLAVFLTMVTDPSHPLRMMVDVFLIMTPFPPIVILNGGKNAVGERRETG